MSPFSTACGACDPCTRGLSARCVAGALFGWVSNHHGLQGAQAEYVRVPHADTTLVRSPEGVDLDVALLLGDVLPTGFYAARRAEVGPRSIVVVLGCGPVGLAAVLAARAAGAERVFAVESVPERRAIAARLGATVFDPGAADIVARLHDEGAPHGADAILEAAGTPAASRLALQLVRPGGSIAVVAVHNEPHFAFSPSEAYHKNVTYRSGRCPARSLMPDLVAWVREHQPDAAQLVTHRWPLSSGVEAYPFFDSKRDGCVKVVFQLV